jgi:peptidoglycan/LPS O-acetylase OafA/YrhL
MDDIALSLAMLLAIAFIGGAVWQWRRRGPDRNMWLMLALAAVLLANVAIWVVPDRTGASPLDRAAAGPG